MCVAWERWALNSGVQVAKVQSSLALGSRIILSQRISWTSSNEWASAVRHCRNTCQHHLAAKNNGVNLWDWGLSYHGYVAGQTFLLPNLNYIIPHGSSVLLKKQILDSVLMWPKEALRISSKPKQNLTIFVSYLCWKNNQNYTCQLTWVLISDANHTEIESLNIT